MFAFEPQRLVARVLAANVALNSLTNVHTHHLGVGAEDGALWLADIDYSREGNFGGVSLDAVARPEGDPRPTYRVAVVRLDDFYDQPRLDLIKIDVEGMEADVLRGTGGLIQRHKPVIYAENDRVEKSPELIRLIRSPGYRLFWHSPPLYSPDNFAGSARNIFDRRIRVVQHALRPCGGECSGPGGGENQGRRRASPGVARSSLTRSRR